MLTKNKDVDFLILGKLDDRTLFQYWDIGKNDPYVQKLCNDESFWLKRLQKTFGSVEKREDRKWKSLYLSLVYFIDKYQIVLSGNVVQIHELRNILRELAIKNDLDILNYFAKRGVPLWFTGMDTAINTENVEMIKYFLPSMQIYSKIDWEIFGILAIKSGNIEILKLFLPHIELEHILQTQSLSYLFCPPAQRGKLDFLKSAFPLLKIKENDLLIFIENFSLPKNGFDIPVEKAKNILTFLCDTYLSIGKMEKLKRAIEAILSKNVKDEEYTKFLKNIREFLREF